VTFIGAGECTITANQAGDASYLGANPVSQTIDVGPSSTPPSPPLSVITTPAISGTSAVVTWVAPASNGGSPITRYTVVVEPGGHGCTTQGVTQCVITGLTPGVIYTIMVSASNAKGVSNQAFTIEVSLVPYLNDSSVLTTRMKRQLDNVALTIGKTSYRVVTLIGYASSTSTPAHNSVLGSERAQGAAKYLLGRLRALGLNGTRMRVVTAGATHFAVRDTTAPANRRTVVILS